MDASRNPRQLPTGICLNRKPPLIQIWPRKPRNQVKSLSLALLGDALPDAVLINIVSLLGLNLFLNRLLRLPKIISGPCEVKRESNRGAERERERERERGAKWAAFTCHSSIGDGTKRREGRAGEWIISRLLHRRMGKRERVWRSGIQISANHWTRVR